MQKNMQFFSAFQKFRKSIDFSKKSDSVIKFHFDVNLRVFNKNFWFFFQWKLTFRTFWILQRHSNRANTLGAVLTYVKLIFDQNQKNLSKSNFGAVSLILHFIINLSSEIEKPRHFWSGINLSCYNISKNRAYGLLLNLTLPHLTW